MISTSFHCFRFPLIILLLCIIASNDLHEIRQMCFLYFEMTVVWSVHVSIKWPGLLLSMTACTVVCVWGAATNWALAHRATPPSSCKNSWDQLEWPGVQEKWWWKMDGWMVKFIMQFAHKVVLYLCLCKVTTSTTAFTADRAAGNSLKKWLSYWKILQRKIYIWRRHSEQEAQF